MATRAVVKAAGDDLEQCVSALVLAFSNDPLVRWMFPEPDRYLRYFGEMVRIFSTTTIANGTAYLAEDFRAAALWMPPGSSFDRGALDKLRQAGIEPARQDEVVSMLGLMGQTHPQEEHWYLQFLGVDLARQGMGYGTALLEHSLKAVDDAHLPAFLVSSNARNQPLYERFGFRVTDVVQTGTSPSVWPMYRDAR